MSKFDRYLEDYLEEDYLNQNIDEVNEKEDIENIINEFFNREKIKPYDYIWDLFEDILLLDDNFYKSFCSFIKKIDGNSCFSNLFKYNFYNDKLSGMHVNFDIENKKTKDMILLIKDAEKNSAEKSEFLKANKIILDDKNIKDDAKILYDINVEDINEQVYTKAENFNKE